MIDLIELKKLARAATPGPWLHRQDPGNPVGVQHGVKLTGEFGAWVCDCLDNADRSTVGGIAGARNADFIAAAHPAAVLELIDLVERQEAELRAARAEVSATGLPELRDQLHAAVIAGEPITLSHLAAGALYHAMSTGLPQGAAPSAPAKPGTAALTDEQIHAIALSLYGSEATAQEFHFARALLVAAAPKWIGVGERLPAEGDLLLIAGKMPADVVSEHDHWRTCATFRGGSFLDTNGCTRNSALYWMPLPASPTSGSPA